MATLVSFCIFLGIEWPILGLIDYKLCLYIKVNINAGQKKFKFISLTIGQNGHQLAQNRPDATF